MSEQPKRYFRKRKKLRRRSPSLGSKRMKARRLGNLPQKPPSTYHATYTKFYVSICVAVGKELQPYEYLAIHENAGQAALAALARLPSDIKPQSVYPLVTVSQKGFYHLSERKLSDSDNTTTAFEVARLRNVLGLPHVEFSY